LLALRICCLGVRLVNVAAHPPISNGTNMSGRIFFNMQGSVAKQRGLVKVDFTP
jgi:hypothetical protein